MSHDDAAIERIAKENCLRCQVPTIEGVSHICPDIRQALRSYAAELNAAQRAGITCDSVIVSPAVAAPAATPDTPTAEDAMPSEPTGWPMPIAGGNHTVIFKFDYDALRAHAEKLAARIAELTREVESEHVARQLAMAHMQDKINTAEQRAESAEARLREAEANDRRYRWLRQNPTFLGWDSDYMPHQIDTAIDTAIRGERG